MLDPHMPIQFRSTAKYLSAILAGIPILLDALFLNIVRCLNLDRHHVDRLFDVRGHLVVGGDRVFGLLVILHFGTIIRFWHDFTNAHLACWYDSTNIHLIMPPQIGVEIGLMYHILAKVEPFFAIPWPWR